jgi:hypothetical protein
MATLETGEAFQLAYLSPDRANGTAVLGHTLGLSEWIEFEAELEVDAEHGGGSAAVAVAFARWGRFVVEVLEPVGGSVEIFRERLAPDGGLRLHHVGVRVADLRAARDQAATAGARCVLSGHFEDQLRFAFVDATAQVGHHLELVEFSDDGWELMAAILAGADSV